MSEKSKKLNFSFKNIDWLKKSKTFLRLGMIISLVSLMVASWATERQEALNEPIFWDTNRVINGIGFLALIIGWGFWEFYIVKKTKKIWFQIVSIVMLVIATVLINGMMGIISGAIAVAIVTTSFVLDYKGIIKIRKEDK